MTDLKRVPLTCIIDLSEYISSMVLWIRVILPCRSGGEEHVWAISECLHKVMNCSNGRDKGLKRVRWVKLTTSVVFHFAPPTVQAALKHPQLLFGDVAWSGVHG